MLLWVDAKALIDETRKLHYRMTEWERCTVERLEALQPKKLLSSDEKTVTKMYRRAAGGETFGLRQRLFRRGLKWMGGDPFEES